MKYILLLFAFFLANTSTAQDTLPKSASFVADYGALLTPEQEGVIESICANLQSGRNALGYLLVIDSLPTGQTILSYTKGIFKKWGLNQEGEGLNFILVYSKKEHAVRIEASDRALQILTKDYIAEVIAVSIKPYLKQRKDYEGLKRGMEMLAKKIESN